MDAREIQAQEERNAMAGRDCLQLSYEDNLETPEKQRSTMRRVFRCLGVGDHEPQTPLKKRLGKPLDQMILNYAELREKLACGPYATFLDP